MVYSILHILLLSRKMLPFWPGSMVVNDYATRKKKKLSHAVEYGLIFHGTRIGKYYCKNMKYRINIYIQVKKKAFKINAKIEDVGLNED